MWNVYLLVNGFVSTDSFIHTGILTYHNTPYQPNLFDSKLYKKSARYSVQDELTTINKPVNSQIDTSKGFFLLNAVAVIWGTQHVVIKSVLTEYLHSSTLNFWRFACSALLFSPYLFQIMRNIGNQTDSRVIRAGLELGLYTFLGFSFQSIGLESTTASRSAFLLYLNVKFVPFLAWILLGRQITIKTWISAALALLGTFFLSTDGGPINVGDIWCIGAAIASALFILRLEEFSKLDAAKVNSVSFSSVAFLCLLWVLGDTINSPSSTSDGLPTGIIDQTNLILSTVIKPFVDHPWPIIYLGIITTALCNYLQTLGQRIISAEKAAIIYSMDPVYGAFFARIFLGEEFGLQGVFGSLCILLGIVLSNSDIPSLDNSMVHESLPVNQQSTVSETITGNPSSLEIKSDTVPTN